MLDNWSTVNVPETFIVYFQNTWINSSVFQWFSGASDYGVTNNGLEATNNAIKNQITLRRRLSIKELIEKLIKAVEFYSVAPEFGAVSQKLTINESQFKQGYDYKSKKASFYIF